MQQKVLVLFINISMFVEMTGLLCCHVTFCLINRTALYVEFERYSKNNNFSFACPFALQLSIYLFRREAGFDFFIFYLRSTIIHYKDGTSIMSTRVYPLGLNMNLK